MERQHWALAALAEEVALASPSSPPPSPSQTPSPPPPDIPSDLWTLLNTTTSCLKRQLHHLSPGQGVESWFCFTQQSHTCHHTAGNLCADNRITRDKFAQAPFGGKLNLHQLDVRVRTWGIARAGVQWGGLHSG